MTERLLIEPAHEAADVNNENLYRDILSAVSIALLNAKWLAKFAIKTSIFLVICSEVPCFIVIGANENIIHNGICIGKMCKTIYEEICVDQFLRKYAYFSGLLVSEG